VTGHDTRPSPATGRPVTEAGTDLSDPEIDVPRPGPSPVHRYIHTYSTGNSGRNESSGSMPLAITWDCNGAHRHPANRSPCIRMQAAPGAIVVGFQCPRESSGLITPAPPTQADSTSRLQVYHAEYGFIGGIVWAHPAGRSCGHIFRDAEDRQGQHQKAASHDRTRHELSSSQDIEYILPMMARNGSMSAGALGSAAALLSEPGRVPPELGGSPE